MKAVIAYKADQKRGHAWRDYFGRSDPGVEFRVWPEFGDPAEVRYLAAWDPIDNLTAEFPKLEVLFSTGAGVDQFDLSSIPDEIQIVRLIDPAIVEGMREYVSFAVLALHRNILGYQQSQTEGTWKPVTTRSAADVCVGVMGLGSLGQAVLDAIEPFGYSLRAWSRSQHEIENVTCFSGSDDLQTFVSGCDILVCLLPLTAATTGILNRDLFNAMPGGSSLVNVGRGGHLVEGDLLSALSSGQLSNAILDVTSEEPLPTDHPFWKNPRILVTPHIASMTGYDTAANALLENIRRHERGERMVGVVDRSLGY
ncbi:MAG TPA: glyoxylate/hydroxypyruvate reductase A [Woeseiaceae bacterium]|nr:glyoxylate/hydroxypyruvate reductase A [Woeseiaceae bacterium]